MYRREGRTRVDDDKRAWIVAQLFLLAERIFLGFNSRKYTDRSADVLARAIFHLRTNIAEWRNRLINGLCPVDGSSLAPERERERRVNTWTVPIAPPLSPLRAPSMSRHRSCQRPQVPQVPKFRSFILGRPTACRPFSRYTLYATRSYTPTRTYAGILKVDCMFVTAFDGVGARGDLEFVGLSDCWELSVFFFFFKLSTFCKL